MPATPLTPTRGKAAAGGGLGKKVGGLPVWAWALAGVAAIGIGLYLRNKLSGTSTSAASPTTAAPADTSGGASSGGGGDTSSSGDQASEDLAGAINGLTAILASGDGSSVGTTDTGTSAPGPVATSPAPVAQSAPSPAPVSGTKATITDAFGNVYNPVPASAGGGYVVGGVYIPGSIAGQPLTTAQIEAYTPPPGEVAQHYPPQTIPSAPLMTATNHPPAPSGAAPKPSATSAGQTAVNERPTVTPHGRAA